MSFPSYPEYKDSGVEWLGEVPQHWDIKPLKHGCLVFPSNVDKKSYEGQSSVFLCNYTDVYYNEKIVEGMGFMPATATDEQIEKFSLRAGDVIFTKDSETADDIAIAAYVPKDIPNVVCGYHLSIVRAGLSADGEFIKRFFDSHSAKSYFAVSANGLTRVGLSQYSTDNLPVSFPPRVEQTQIARFLDHETARIDALIEEQQRLIELLKEKRQAVISHAVTKGLDPTVPMKDSGVEWLGEVPAHWVVSRAKLVSDIFVPQRNKPELNDSEGVAWVTMEDMNGGYISATSLKVTELAADEAGSKVLKKGAVIASCVGRFGIVAINAVDVVINQQLQAFEPIKIKAEYLKNIVSLSKEYFELVGTAATLVYVNQLGFENLPVLIPSGSEQESICLYVDEANARFDALLSQSFESIQLLQERRSALISAAVTGKINVRGWQPPASAPIPELEQEAV